MAARHTPHRPVSIKGLINKYLVSNCSGAILAEGRFRQDIQSFGPNPLATAHTIAIAAIAHALQRGPDPGDFFLTALAKMLQHLVAFGFNRSLVPVLGMGFVQFSLDLVQTTVQFG